MKVLFSVLITLLFTTNCIACLGIFVAKYGRSIDTIQLNSMVIEIPDIEYYTPPLVLPHIDENEKLSPIARDCDCRTDCQCELK